jgi:hypothetical protein
MKCQVPTCNKQSTKEIHVIGALKTDIFLLCEEHFSKVERYYKSHNQQREIYDLIPKEQREIVQFT